MFSKLKCLFRIFKRSPRILRCLVGHIWPAGRTLFRPVQYGDIKLFLQSSCAWNVLWTVSEIIIYLVSFQSNSARLNSWQHSSAVIHIISAKVTNSSPHYKLRNLRWKQTKYFTVIYIILFITAFLVQKLLSNIKISTPPLSEGYGV